ncbi:GIY-YIG nuclease family protein [Halodesulfovibrio spirochaetisodalis]|uniref:Excinuclease ABC subunit C n=1 Tax=Halodesulfovibrio spirochaetisodalis TaxID=1560234 RepID=A0A1B7XD53_9BACT|nr:GIY-YIG nuclease family protein [Halodesulfovibrio spirochaetisodalis]OBQ51915.1 excinuclease ABC subunit C [Halodesulfovibrio spirochaetisodalis]
MSKEKPWVVYLVQCADGSLYCGITTDMDRRLGEHNSGKGAKYTRSRRPVSLIASAFVPNRSIASKIECNIKRQPSGKKVETLNRCVRELTSSAAQS